MRSRVVLAWILAALVCAGVPAVLWIGSQGGDGQVVPSILGASWALTGALLITARTRNAVGWLVLLCGVMQGWSAFGNRYGGYGVGQAEPMWPAADWVAQSSSMVYLPSLLLPVTVIMALYPAGRLESPRWRVPVVVFSAALALLTILPSLSQDAYDDIAPGPAPISIEGPGGAWGTLFFGLLASMVVASFLAIWLMTGLRLARAQPPQRAQLAWYVATVVPGFLAFFFLGLPPWLNLIVGMALPAAIAVGVLRYRLLGIVLPPLLVYGCLTAVVVAVFVAVSALAGTALDRGPVPAVIAAGLVAVGLTPARERVQRGADRFVYGDRRDPMRAVVSLGDQVQSADPESLLGVVLRSVADAVRAPGASVTDRQGQVLAVEGQVPQAADSWVLVVAGEPVGALRVAPRTAGSRYTSDERRILQALAPQVAVVVQVLDLAGALEAQRDRVVEATAAERDRLRHELHDGLGPSLAGSALGLRAARDALAADDRATLSHLLDRISAEVDLAVADVHRVIDDLRPADLAAGSLDTAVRRRATSVSSVVDVEVQVGALPQLRPELETAAYRIASEALANVARHSGAHQVHVALAVLDGALTLRVADDGSGIPVVATRGVGLESMRRRAHAVGGTFEIDSGRNGTVVTARLPL